MNFLIEQLEAAVEQTEKLLFADEMQQYPSTDHYISGVPNEAEEQDLMLQHDERELSLLMIQQKQRIFTHLNEVEQRANSEAKTARVVSPIKTRPLPNYPPFEEALPTNKSATELSPLVSDYTSTQLLEHTISFLLYELTHDPLSPHALVMTITAMSVDITMKSIMQQIRFHSLSLPIFFEEQLDDRIKALHLLKLLDQSCISPDQRRKLRKQFDTIVGIQSDVEWQSKYSFIYTRFLPIHLIPEITTITVDLLRDVIRSFFIKHRVSISVGPEEGIKIGTSEVSLEKYLCEGYRGFSKIIILKAPRGKLKRPKH